MYTFNRKKVSKASFQCFWSSNHIPKVINQHTCIYDDTNSFVLCVSYHIFQVLQILIDDFGVAILFGHKNIQYFADMTRTGIRVREKFRYEVRYPAGESTGCKLTICVFLFQGRRTNEQDLGPKEQPCFFSRGWSLIWLTANMTKILVIFFLPFSR